MQFLHKFGVHFGNMFVFFLRSFLHPLSGMQFYINFVAFQGGPPLPGGRRRQGRRPLWEDGNIAFWGPEGGFPVCFSTFCKSACEAAQG